MKRMCARLMALGVSISLLFTGSACSLTGDGKSSSTITPGSSITLGRVVNKVDDIVEKEDSESATLVGVLTYLDTANDMTHMLDIESGVEYEVPYSGGTDIRSAYDKVIADSSMELGGIYDVYINKSGKASAIIGNSDAWERNDVSRITIDENNRKITIGASVLFYEENTVVLSGGERINIAKIVDQDNLVLRGIGEKIYSINVTSGHGYVEFSGLDAFEGGYVTIGKQLFSVTEGMLVTSPVGTYTVEIQLENVSATKTVTVKKDETSKLDFSEYVPEATKYGTVNFSITPNNAILSIDGVEVDYSEPLSLEYGRHYLTLACNHYEEYTETFVVNSSYKTKVIDMVSNGTGTTTTESETTVDNTSGYTVNVQAPTGAALYVDSVYVGIIPCTFAKSYGNKTITLKKSGYKTVSYTISITNTTGNLTYSFPDMEEASTESETESATSN